MRLFIAIKMPENLKKEINEDIKYFSKKINGVKWVDSNKLHLTVKFLGEAKKDINRIKDNLEKISVDKFNMRFKDKYEAFYRKNFAKVIHLPIKKDKSLMLLHKKIVSKMAKLGFKAEKRDYYPHITIGRVKKGNIKREKLEKLFEKRKVELDSFMVKKFNLIKSTLTHKGPIYNSIKKVELK
ncbi:MAG: RNA 2',3'-cyclic phosphodiesterase [Candidatus Mcinerneyibacterium aminivorans]|uniref:RNA 2',3'-cyclic phosphodiesterase n=1 Tax=Candidatus Mcinerneyibacterium aminivorans TaxID=2703815 RepID=A0A5D0MJB7_9BACT|nr:MAG: RNA 2',3'-cyclic phosphodiesterase [Candidatus Mcinerneyibacterium aminivorans]